MSIRDANPAFERIMGLRRDQIVGHRARELVPAMQPGMDEDIRKSLEAGFTAHLTKPVDIGRLELTLRRICAG